MAKLSKADAKKAEKLARFLDEYVALTDAIGRVSKKKYEFGVTVNNDDDDSDFLSVGVDRSLAKAVLMQQRQHVKIALRKLGVVVA